jgi:NADH:ubiquinone oxidoreductase subunit E
MRDSLEEFWEELLSRQPERIWEAFSELQESDKEAVLVHLRRMSREEGWHPEQRRSARAALAALSARSARHPKSDS